MSMNDLTVHEGAILKCGDHFVPMKIVFAIMMIMLMMTTIMMN